MDTIYATLPLIDHPDYTVRYTVSLSKISMSLFLFCDHVLWLSRTGIFEINSDKWAKLSSKYWLYSLTMNLVRDFYEVLQILKREQNTICPQRCRSLSDVASVCGKAASCVQSHKDVMVDIVKNGCDFFIPLTALGYTKLSPSVVGALGVISSIAGMLTVLDPKCKLTPV